MTLEDSEGRAICVWGEELPGRVKGGDVLPPGRTWGKGGRCLFICAPRPCEWHPFIKQLRSCCFGEDRANMHLGRSTVFSSGLYHYRQAAQSSGQPWCMAERVDRISPALVENGSISLLINDSLLAEELGKNYSSQK